MRVKPVVALLSAFNCLSTAGTLTVEFKKPWNLLAKTTFLNRELVTETEQTSNWWGCLAEVRTYFETECP